MAAFTAPVLAIPFASTAPRPLRPRNLTNCRRPRAPYASLNPDNNNTPPSKSPPRDTPVPLAQTAAPSAAPLLPQVGSKISERLVVDATELGLLRQRIRILQAKLDDAVATQEYMTAAELRDSLNELRQRDPQTLFERLHHDLEEALAREDYSQCCHIRDGINQIKTQLPQFAVAGLWQGSYGQKGGEKVHISIQGNELRAKKLTGDVNVPAGEFTFCADLSPDGVIRGTEFDAIERALHMFPHMKNIQRFRGEGQIAEAGFQNPRWIPGELIIFEDGVIAFVWKSLAFLVIFERTTEIR